MDLAVDVGDNDQSLAGAYCRYFGRALLHRAIRSLYDLRCIANLLSEHLEAGPARGDRRPTGQ